jgi:hypothetical protein
MDPRAFKQEYEASFEHTADTIYDLFSDKLNVSNNMTINDSLPIIIGMDFNIDPFVMVVCQYIPKKREFHIIEEIILHNSNTSEAGRLLLEKYGETDIEIWADYTGNARGHNIGVSDISILRNYGFEVYSTRIKEQSDKYNAVRAWILDASGHRTLKINSNCTTLIERMLHIGYSDTDDHITDALAYAILKYKPIEQKQYEDFFSGNSYTGPLDGAIVVEDRNRF